MRFPLAPRDDPGSGLSIELHVLIVGDAPGVNGGIGHRCRQTNQMSPVGAVRTKDISDSEVADDHS
jgi:hypothetical protein